MIGEWSRKISNQICENQNEKEIIQYGLNQLLGRWSCDDDFT